MGEAGTGWFTDEGAGPQGRSPSTRVPFNFHWEASECLVGSSVFKTDEGAKVPWRVRFPSASANGSLANP